MQVPLEWIKEVIGIENIELEELIERLTLGGFEVEEILEIEINSKKQLVLDISATANRSDSLSIQGISSEIASLLDKPVNQLTYTNKIDDWKQKIITQKESIIADLGYSTFLAFEIKNIDNFTVPRWIQEKLMSAGVRPTNNLSDFQTYILLETGYPFAFYDLDKIRQKTNSSKLVFSIENPTTNQEFVASNSAIYKLNDSNLIIKANNFPFSIAGMIEHEEAIYSEKTKTLLVEGSIFNASKIRQQSRNLGLRTDRSARYEKSLKQTYLLDSLYRLIFLLRVNNPNLKCKLCKFLQEKEEALKIIKLNYSTIQEILGPIYETSTNESKFIPPKKVSEYLQRLNFEFSYQNSELTWDVQVPHLRNDDIRREIDLIEEVGRLHGFNNFLTTLPKITKIGTEDLSYKTRAKMTSCFLNLGLNELIHYSLVGEDQPKSKVNQIHLINPLLADYKNLRTSLVPTLIDTVAENLKQSNRIIEGFEYGHVFSGDILDNFKEVEHVAGIFGGTKEKLSWSEPNQTITWFEAKGKIEQLFKQLNMGVYWKIESLASKNNIFHPYRTAEIYLLNGQNLGKFGQIHPAYANINGLPSDIYLFEFSLQHIQKQLQEDKIPIFQEYSLYPRVIKDLSFIVPKDKTFMELKNVLSLNGTKFLSEINLLDEYRGPSIPKDCTSLCLQLIFQSNKKTLENKEIERIINNLQTVLTSEFNAIIRE
uniref:Phenylalanine--tRNA ligase beta subunit, chloroplastic n=1 Tax=Halamphora calidilacuna TaxID=2133758 RepID=A0A516ZBG8_9STRA|nr:Phenylalanine tRNA synthetase [Halamphora calidilacuna]QDR25042.1 Phenylalanine tRNA synthetase [Halamphora calidilacuna]